MFKKKREMFIKNFKKLYLYLYLYLYFIFIFIFKLTVEFKDYINENRTALNELFSNYISYSWKAFKNQEQNRINERGKNTSYNSDKLISPKGNENSEEKEEITSLQFRILERLKMIQDRTIISAKRLLIDKMETSKVLEIEWSKIIYNLYREKAIWEKASDEIKYWKLGNIY